MDSKNIKQIIYNLGADICGIASKGVFYEIL